MRWGSFIIFASAVLVGGIVCAQNHPNSYVIERILARWDGEYPISFCVLGDNYSVCPIFRAILSQIDHLSDSIDFVITTGDHAAGGDSAGYQRYIESIDSIDAPWLTVMGNHEINDSLGWERFHEWFGPPDFFFDLGVARFIALTDCYPASTVVSGTENVYYKFTDEQLDWLEERLAEWDGYKFVFVHAPPYLSGHITVGVVGGPFYSPGYDESLTERFTDLLRDYNVYVCFCGHIHCYDRWTPHNDLYGDVTYLITGGAGAMLTPWIYGAPYGGSFFHFLLVQLYQSGTLVGYVIRPDTVDDGVVTVDYDTIYSFVLAPPSEVFGEAPAGRVDVAPFPNPFSRQVRLPHSREKLCVFDISGRLVDEVSPRDDVILWRPRGIKPGVYIIRAGKKAWKVVYAP